MQMMILFFVAPMRQEHFFKNGLPCDCPLERVHVFKKGGIDHIVANDLELLNDHFLKKRYFEKIPQEMVFLKL